MEEPRGTEAPTSGVVDTAARGASQSRAAAPAALLTRTVGEDGFIKWHIARPRGRWRVMKVAAVAAAAAAPSAWAISLSPGTNVPSTPRHARRPHAPRRRAGGRGPGRGSSPAGQHGSGSQRRCRKRSGRRGSLNGRPFGNRSVRRADCGRAGRSRGRATPGLACQGGLLGVPGTHDDRTRPPPPRSSGPTALARGGAGHGRAAWRSGFCRALDHRRPPNRSSLVPAYAHASSSRLLCAVDPTRLEQGAEHAVESRGSFRHGLEIDASCPIGLVHIAAASAGSHSTSTQPTTSASGPPHFARGRGAVVQAPACARRAAPGLLALYSGQYGCSRAQAPLRTGTAWSRSQRHRPRRP